MMLLPRRHSVVGRIEYAMAHYEHQGTYFIIVVVILSTKADSSHFSSASSHHPHPTINHVYKVNLYSESHCHFAATRAALLSPAAPLYPSAISSSAALSSCVFRQPR